MVVRAYFAFHYKPDVQRASIVRQSWRTQDRKDAGFFDGSLWESAQRKGDDSLKALMRDGVKNTSVTAILAGTQTWERRWVRYEIARSVLKGNRLVTIDINQIRNFEKKTSLKGVDPLATMGVYRDTNTNKLLLAEWKNDKWVQYADYNLGISVGDFAFADPPTTTTVDPFSLWAKRYDYVGDDGYSNMGDWLT